MIDYSLKFADSAQAASVLFTEDAAIYPNTDVIGIIMRPTGVMVANAEGLEEPVIEALPGWHVNVRSEEPIPELEPYLVYPVNPVRVWASGGMGAGEPDPTPIEEIPYEPLAQGLP